jgi:hypothetical protein
MCIRPCRCAGWASIESKAQERQNGSDGRLLCCMHLGAVRSDPIYSSQFHYKDKVSLLFKEATKAVAHTASLALGQRFRFDSYFDIVSSCAVSNFDIDNHPEMSPMPHTSLSSRTLLK